MTKQEAKDLFRACKSDFIIEKLYQYFTERGCDSCQYLKTYQYEEDKRSNGVSTYWKPYIDDKYEFYCNSYKRKTEN